MKKKIFLVEDNPDILANLETALNLKGYATASLNTGEQAMERILEYRPDLVILDIMIPKPNGYQICYMLKANEQTKKTPVLLISAKNEDIDIKLGFRMGADRYIPKPFKKEELLQAVESLL